MKTPQNTSAKLAIILASLFLASCLLASCTYIENWQEKSRLKEQAEFEEMIVKSLPHRERRDTLTLGLVLGWNDKQVMKHCKNLIKKGAVRLEDGLMVFDIAFDIANESSPVILLPNVKNDKLIGVVLLLKNRIIPANVMISSLGKSYNHIGSFYITKPFEYHWFYSGSNLKITLFQDSPNEGLQVNITDRLMQDSINKLENEKNQKKVEETKHIL